MVKSAYMWPILLILLGLSAVSSAQQGQEGPRPEWPCVAGSAVDPSYIEASESTGGQLFLFQKNEVAHTGVVMRASFTHPATVFRAIGYLSGAREFTFLIDSAIESAIVMASLQCRKAIDIVRPGGQEMTAANTAESIELQAGRIVRVDNPEPGQWKVRLTGTGLFVLSVVAKTSLKLGAVNFTLADQRMRQPRLGVQQYVEAHLIGDLSHVKLQVISADAQPLSEAETAQAPEAGSYRAAITPTAARLRIVVSGIDAAGWPFQRTEPVLFRAEDH
jgi:hypothetical protein